MQKIEVVLFGNIESTNLVKLSRREILVLRLLSECHANKEMAARMGTTTATVKVYIQRLKRHLGMENTRQLALWAAQNREFLVANTWREVA